MSEKKLQDVQQEQEEPKFLQVIKYLKKMSYSKFKIISMKKHV